MTVGEVLGAKFIAGLLALVGRGEGDQTATLTAGRERLHREIDNLLDLTASGIPAETTAPKRDRQTSLATVDAQLRRPPVDCPKVEQLRVASEQRAAIWEELAPIQVVASPPGTAP